MSSPISLIIFGATGDVVARKVIPSLFHLFRMKQLSQNFHIIGFSRRDFDDHAFRSYVESILIEHTAVNTQTNELSNFLQLFSYIKVQFDRPEDYEPLTKLSGQKLLYFAVPPALYPTILNSLEQAEIASAHTHEDWIRVLVEKPIGSDEQTSNEINEQLGRLFDEDQIYRIEHYLAKEMVRNILAFRFHNDLFESRWNRDHIESVSIHLHETLGVEKRGNFYDSVGTLRDVGQNHLLELLALIAMDQPERLNASSIQRARTNVLGHLHPWTDMAITEQTVRAQYDGYREIIGVAPDSQTETYARVTTYLDLPRWDGVPFTLEAGKRMGNVKKEIKIVFKHKQPCLCENDDHRQNRLIISLQPEEAVRLEIFTKKSGREFVVEQRTINVHFRPTNGVAQYVEEYAQVLLDAVKGDQTLFVSSDELKAMWKFIDPIVEGWKKNLSPLKTYQPDTNKITI